MPLSPLSEDQFPDEVRSFMRDHPELNRLISGGESSTRLIEDCMWLALDEWNTTPPLMNHRVENFPSRVLLLQLTLCHLLTSVGILRSRNRFRYNEGGFSAETDSQDGLYQRWIQLLRAQAAPGMQSLKVSMNIASGWGGGIGSDYAFVHGWYGTP